MNQSKPEPILEIRDLKKSFGGLHALRGVTFSLDAGERLALLGPNGAGKTTLIRCLSGLTRPDRGEILLAGRPLEAGNTRTLLGLVPQEIALYGDLTVRQNLRAFGKFYGLKRSELKDRLEWALSWTGLEDRSNDLVGGFSGGMKRRVNLACGVMHSPQVLLLDEPTVGVDPQSRQRIFTMLDELSRAGTSILLTTHHLDEAEERSDRIVILDQGQVVANGTIDKLVDESVGASRMVRIRVDRPLVEPIRVRAPMQHRSEVSGRPTVAVDSYEAIGGVGDRQVATRIDDVSTQLPRLIDTVRRSGYRVDDVEVQAPSLHHVFLHLTGYELRD